MTPGLHDTMAGMVGPRRAVPFSCADERTTLEDWLDFHRATLAAKCARLTEAQLRLAAVPPSSLSLLGIVQHMAQVERHWFRRVLAGEDVAPVTGTGPGPEGASDGFAVVDTVSAEQVLAVWTAEMAQARTNAVAYALDERRRYRDWDTNLRSIYVHMIGEYARHNGHADLIRERIDGRTGL
jgi:uncharacterized damage-inducible protein DinB